MNPPPGQTGVPGATPAGGPTPVQNIAAQRAAERMVETLKKQARAQQSVGENASNYFNVLKDISGLQKNIEYITKQRIKLEKEEQKLLAGDPQKAILQEHIKLMQKELDLMDEERKGLIRIAKETNKASVAFNVMGAAAKGAIGLIGDGYAKLKTWGVFDMDKAMKNSALEMGILSKQTIGFRKGIQASALGVGETNQSTIELGVGIEDLAKMQAAYSAELGRTVTFADSGNQAMAQLAKGTTLGADGAAQFAASMELLGKSAEQTRDFTDQTMNDAHKMGLNASKVIKNIASNMKLLNKYNFKGGTKGLEKMALTATKFGVTMDGISGMADKLMNIEGAVEMSAQLQVLGGEWAALADPFKLMYMARNDMEGLQKAIVNATKGTAKLNAETGEFDIAPLELARLRNIAEQTGLSFDELATSAKNAAKFARVDADISFNVDPATKEFIESTAKFKNGKATIDIDGKPKLISALNAVDLAKIRVLKDENADLRQRALDAQTFEDKLGNLLTTLKSTLVPVVEGMNNVFKPLFSKFFADADWKKGLIGLGEKIANFAVGVSKVIKFGGDLLMTLGPGGALATVLGGKLIFGVAKWFANGVALGEGFLATQGAGATGMKGLGGFMGSGLSKVGGGSMLKGAGMAGAAGLAGWGVGALTDKYTDKGSGWNIAGKAASGVLTGAALGAFLGPIGAALGAAIGGISGGVGAYMDSKGATNDGIFASPIHDGISKGLGSDFSKGRGILQGGKITPIDNKDDLLAMKPGGPVDRANKSASSGHPGKIDINFGDIKFDGKITLDIPGGTGGKDITENILQDAHFIRSLTRLIHAETERAVKGGKVGAMPTK